MGLLDSVRREWPPRLSVLRGPLATPCHPRGVAAPAARAGTKSSLWNTPLPALPRHRDPGRTSRARRTRWAGLRSRPVSR
jgi:hypothetical protein